MTLISPPRTTTLRQKRGEGQETFAAAAALSLGKRNDIGYLQQTVRSSRFRSMQAWKWYDKIGEVHYALARAARIAGYSHLHAEHLEPNGEWIRVDDGSPAADIVAGIYSPFGGLRGLISTYFTLSKVPSDMLLIRYRDDDGYDGYHFISPDSVDSSSLDQLSPERQELKWVSARYGADQTNKMIRRVDPKDVLGRVWVPHPRFPDEPDSALGALLTECEVLWAMTQNLKAKLVSRFAAAGILFVPDKMQNLQVQGVDGVQMAANGLEYLIKAMMTNLENWEDAEALLPILMSGPGEVGEQIKHIIFDREVWKTDIEIRRELIDRIFTGLDINTQATKGVGEQTHWNAWAVSDDELRLVAKPDLQNCCWAMTRLILQDQLMAETAAGGFGMNAVEAANWRIGFDMTEATSKTNQQEDGRQMNDRGWLQGDRLAEISGFEMDDKMSPNEYIRWVGRQTKNPFLMLFDGDVLSDADWDEVERFGGKKGPAGAVGEDPQAGPGVGDPGSPNPADKEN